MKKYAVITSCFDTLSGYGKKSYDICKSIIDLKHEEWDIHLISLKWGNTKFGYLPDDDYVKKYSKDNTLQRKPDIYIHIGIPNEFNPIGEYNILFTSGIETTIVPSGWIEGCNKADLIIVPSEFTKKVFLDSKYELRDDSNGTTTPIEVTKPINVLFEGFNEDIFRPLNSMKDYKSDELSSVMKNITEDFCFLFVGTWLQGNLGQDRKDVGMLIKVFLETFKNKVNNRPALILKTSGATTSILDRDDILNKINSIRNTVSATILPNIYLIHGELTDEEMNELYNHRKVKSFVSFTKGEGFGKPILEFTSATAKPIIVSNWSGHLDYLDRRYVNLLGGNLTKIDQSAVVKDMLIPESSWFTVNYQDGARVMADVFDNYKSYSSGARLQQIYSSKYSLTAMKEKLSQLIDECIPVEREIILPDFVNFDYDLP